MKKYTAISIGLIIVLLVFGFAVYEMREAQKYANLALVDELVAQSISLRASRFDLSLLLSVEAFRLADTPQTRGILLDSVQANPQLIQYLPSDAGSSVLAFSPNGKLLAIGGTNGTIVLWDVAAGTSKGQLVAKWEFPKDVQAKPGEPSLGSVSNLIFTPDGKILIASIYTLFADQRTIALWDVATGQPISQPLLENKSPYDLLLSPDGRTLAISEWGKISFWDLETNQFVGQFPVPQFEGIPIGLNTMPVVSSPVFSPDGKTLAAISSVNTITFWDVATLQPIGQPLMVGEMYVNNGVEHIAFTKDGKSLLTFYPDGTLASWDLTTRQSRQLWHPLHTEDSWLLYGFGAIFNSDASIVAISDSSVINVLNTETGQSISEPLRGNTNRISDMTFSPNGKMLAIASYKGVILWDLSNRQSFGQLLVQHGEAIGFTPDGNILAAGWPSSEGFPAIALWDSKSYQFTTKLEPAMVANAATFSPDGKRLIAGDNNGKVAVWDVATQQLLGHLDFGTNSYISSVTFSPDGRTIAIGGQIDVGVNLWDGISSKVDRQSLKASVYGESSLAFSPDGRTLAVGDTSGSIILWDISSRRSVKWSSTLSSVDSVVFSPNGQELASTSRDGKIFLWDVKSQRLLGQPFILPSGGIPDAVAFSPDGKMLISGNYDNTINLWDVATRELIGQGLLGNEWPVNQVVFSPDGNTLATVSNNITLWDANPQSWFDKICQRVGRNFTRNEWAQYFPGETYRATCPQWPLEAEPTPTPISTP